MNTKKQRFWVGFVGLCLVATLVGCAALHQEHTTRDKTKKGAAIGAASGAAGALLLGERELDEVLVGAAIGAGVGAGVGAYMDHQEEKLAHIPGTTVERVEDGVLLLRFDSDVLFDTGSAVLGSTASSTLDQASEVFLEYRKTAILAQGFTDAVGGEEYNQQLSVRRARSVMNHLIGRGLEPDRITAVGYGEGYPVASNDTSDGRRQNRRVNLLLKAKAR